MAVGPLSITAAGLIGQDVEEGETVVHYGTTVGATYNAAMAGSSCGNVAHTSPGVWYTVLGTGDRMTASTCSPATTYDTVVSVYTAQGKRQRRRLYHKHSSILRGSVSNRELRILKQDNNNNKQNDNDDDNNDNTNDNTGSGAGGGGGAGEGNYDSGVCSSMSCVGVNDDAGQYYCASSSTHSTVSWDTVRGQTYYLLVHGFYGRTGNFALNIVNSRPLNTRCDSAIDLIIDPSNTVIGTTYQASLPWGENGQTQCGA